MFVFFVFLVQYSSNLKFKSSIPILCIQKNKKAFESGGTRTSSLQLLLELSLELEGVAAELSALEEDAGVSTDDDDLGASSLSLDFEGDKGGLLLLLELPPLDFLLEEGAGASKE